MHWKYEYFSKKWSWPCLLQAPWSVQTRRHSWPMQVLNPPVCPTWRTQSRSPRPRGGACSQHGLCGLYGLCGLRGLHSLSPLQLQLLPSPPAKTDKQTSPLPTKTNKLTKLQQRCLWRKQTKTIFLMKKVKKKNVLLLLKTKNILYNYL